MTLQDIIIFNMETYGKMHHHSSEHDPTGCSGRVLNPGMVQVQSSTWKNIYPRYIDIPNILRPDK